MKTTFAALVFCAVMGFALEASAQFTFFLDGSSLPGDNGWTVENNPGVLVDLGGGNSGIQQTDDDTSGTSGRHGLNYDEFYLSLGDASATMATRFRVDSYSYTGTDFIDPLALTTVSGDPDPAIGLGIRDLGSGDRWALIRFIYGGDNLGDPAEILLDVAPVVVGEFNEARIHIDGATDLVRFSWNGTEVYNAVTVADYDGGTSYPEWGASNYWGEGGTSVLTFDWVGYGPGFIPPVIPGDVNNDGFVDIFDVNVVSANWGSPGGPTGDANGDGNVDIFDVNLISANWSPPPAPVAEPSSLVLAAIAVAAVVGSALRRRRP